MGYFSNGTEGLDYEEHYCTKCIHDVKQDCPIMLLHLLYNYDQFGKTPHSETIATVLGTLIPLDDDHNNLQCKMFIPLTDLKERPAKTPVVESEKARTFWMSN